MAQVDPDRIIPHAKFMKSWLTPGSVRKGGQNPPPTGDVIRPKPPMGSNGVQMAEELRRRREAT